MEPSTRKVVQRSPAHTVRLLHLPHLQPEAIEADSSVERDFVHCAALFPNVASIKSQPFKLNLPSGKKYTPDYLVTFQDGSRAVVEVKPEKFVASFHAHFEQVRLKLSTSGIPFLLALDNVLRREGLAERALYIRRYAKGACDAEAMHKCKALLEQVGDHGLSVKELTQAGVTQATMLYMVTRRQVLLSADLHYEGNAKVRLFNQSVSGESHAIRFADWLDA